MEESKFICSEQFYKYISKVDTGRDIIEILEEGMRSTMITFKFMSEEKANYAYESGKWTVKELFGHCIDTEKIMGYRALCISRGETAPLPGFDENSYVENANFKHQKLGDLLEHYKMVRFSNMLLIKSFSPEMLDRQGISNNIPLNVRAIIYMIAGHEVHHAQVLKEQYGVK